MIARDASLVLVTVTFALALVACGADADPLSPDAATPDAAPAGTLGGWTVVADAGACGTPELSLVTLSFRFEAATGPVTIAPPLELIEGWVYDGTDAQIIVAAYPYGTTSRWEIVLADDGATATATGVFGRILSTGEWCFTAEQTFAVTARGRAPG